MLIRKSLLLHIALGAAASLALAGPASAANLLVNGGFEDSDSLTTTPPGWSNIGATQGIVPYSAVTTQPVYEGENFYTIGGVATNGISAIGWGISQSVATTIGNTYRLSFGYSGENGPGLETILGATVGGLLSQYTITSTADGFFTRPFTTATIDYVATSNLTPISFTLLGSNEIGLIGNNDPMIDGVSFEQIAVRDPGGVPEPATWAMMILGFAAIGAGMRRRRPAPLLRFA